MTYNTKFFASKMPELRSEMELDQATNHHHSWQKNPLVLLNEHSLSELLCVGIDTKLITERKGIINKPHY